MDWKTLSIGKKMAVGFGCVLILLAAVVIMNLTGVGHIVTNAKQVIEGNQLDGTLAQKEVDHLNWVEKVNTLLTDDSVTTLAVQTDDHKCGFGEWLYGEGRQEAEAMVPSLASLLKEIETPHAELHESAIDITKVFRQADLELPALLAQREVDHFKWINKISSALIMGHSSLDVETDPTQCALGKWLATDAAEEAYQRGSETFKKNWDELLVQHELLHHSAIDVQEGLSFSNEKAEAVFEETTMPILEKTAALLETLEHEAEADIKGMHEASEIYASHTIPALEAVQHLLGEIREEARENIMTDEVMLDAAQGTKRNVTVAGVLTIIFGLVLAFVIPRGICKAILRVVEGLNEGAEQVASASGQISSSSQQLAEGASEQAASIEETSSSLEEMSAMTKQNAENANEADNLMKEANQVVTQANDSMTELTTSMAEISKASEETSKIIKTIDEIAFQTNLLALNAAVEAARAGEAGAGFAVVADEVRNLAMRAAEASKNTADLIEGTVKRVNDGSELVGTTNEAFTEMAGSTSKVGELVGEIAAASNEQADGIEQVNRAVSEMDKVVQQNAANAEESASASEEMNAQAMQMRDYVTDLMAMVGGTKNGNGSNGSLVRPIQHNVLSTAGKKETMPQVPKGVVVSPEKLIPLEKDDFKDF